MNEPRRQRSGTRATVAWCVYDWANSAFPAIITTFVFAPYFVKAVAENEIDGTAQWGWAVTASALVVALLSPPLGAIADAGGPRKPWLAALTGLAVVSCFLLWFVRPTSDDVLYALVVFAIANISFEFATVYYNAMLPDIAPANRIGRVSGWGWGLGYAGGLICLLIVLFGFVQADPLPFGLDRESLEHVRVVGPISALWYGIFALPLFWFVPDRRSRGLAVAEAVRRGLANLRRSLVEIRRYRNIVRFLVARMIYTDGLNTLFAFGGIYAAGTFGMDTAEIILFGIALNATAGLGAAAFAWVDDRIGAKRTVLIALLALTLIGGGLVLVQSKLWFWLLGMALGVFFGPAQAASRSLMARLAPAEMMTEMFGLYALSGKATAFVGPLILGWVTLATHSQRAGMATVLVFIFLGGVMLLTVRDPHAVESES